MRYGFIGLGNLGGHLAASLLRNGFELAVNDIDRMSAEPLIRAGARWASTPSALGTEVDCVITCLPSPAVSETVLKEVLQTLKPGSTWIEMSTLGRDEILGLALIAAEKDVRTLECPVTGGVHLASSGKVTVLAGGDKNSSSGTVPRSRRWVASSSTWDHWERRRSSRSSPTCWPSSILWRMAKH